MSKRLMNRATHSGQEINSEGVECPCRSLRSFWMAARRGAFRAWWKLIAQGGWRDLEQDLGSKGEGGARGEAKFSPDPLPRPYREDRPKPWPQP